jgi:hypothetical protein
LGGNYQQQKQRAKQKQKKQKQKEPSFTSYDMSEHEDSDWSDSPGENGKRIPDWAKSSNLRRALHQQSVSDPDEVFAPLRTDICNLSEIFRGYRKKKRFRNRTSSGNWFIDRLHWKEEQAYKKAMGFTE